MSMKNAFLFFSEIIFILFSIVYIRLRLRAKAAGGVCQNLLRDTAAVLAAGQQRGHGQSGHQGGGWRGRPPGRHGAAFALPGRAQAVRRGGAQLGTVSAATVGIFFH